MKVTDNPTTQKQWLSSIFLMHKQQWAVGTCIQVIPLQRVELQNILLWPQ